MSVNPLALTLSGVSLGQQLSFHGIAQHAAFPAFVAPDYADVFAYAHSQHPYRSVVGMYDRAVPGVKRFLDTIEGQVKAPLLRFPLKAGEQLKTLEAVGKLTYELGKKEVGGKSLMLIIGGGTLCNAAGFLAATWAGMESVVIPTNFTAIADVAIGSLQLLNLGERKNRLKLCSDPLTVVLDPNFFKTLPESEKRNGLAETVKHGVAQDAILFEALEKHVKAGTIFDDTPLFDFALRTAQLKDELMGRDPFGEKTQNIFLYGHILAHAFEPATHFSMPHGAAVSLGILGELAFFHRPDAPTYKRVHTVLKGLGLPITLPDSLTDETIMEHLSHAMMVDGRLPIPQVREIGALEKSREKHIQDFDREAVLGVIHRLRR